MVHIMKKYLPHTYLSVSFVQILQTVFFFNPKIYTVKSYKTVRNFEADDLI